jgi:hypothetical protein
LGNYLGVPLEWVGNAENVIDHGGLVGAGMEEAGAVGAAEVDRREEVAERAGQLQRSPGSRCIHLEPRAAPRAEGMRGGKSRRWRGRRRARRVERGGPVSGGGFRAVQQGKE